MFSLSLYHKRNPFPFSVLRISYLFSNMPPKIFHDSLGAETFRNTKLLPNLESISHQALKIVSEIIKQGGNKKRIKQCLSKCMDNILKYLDHFTYTN